jgi:cysteine desulfurase
MIYLDNNATTRTAPEVREAMAPFLDDYYANPSSPYTFARTVSVALTQAREQLAQLLKVSPAEVIFTSGGSESINSAFHAACVTRPEQRHIVISAVEHAATCACAERLEQQGYRVSRIPVDAAGALDLDAYEAALTPDTALVSLMKANNETGIIFPLRDLMEQAAARGIPFHCDATQAIGKHPFSADLPGLTYVSISGHKFHAPKGVGALIVRKPTAYVPLMVGGDQEQSRRAGTENVAGAVGLGAAALLVPAGLNLMEQHVRGLRDRLEEQLTRQVPDCRVIGVSAARLPNTSLVSFPDAPSEVVLALLDMEGVCCSSGSACASASSEPSHVLRAMHIPATAAAGVIRVSLSRYTTRGEVDDFLERLVLVLRKLKSRSQ